MGKGDRGRLSPSGRGQRPRRLRYRLLPPAPCPLQWRLFLPKEWASDTDRRSLTRIPADVTHREEWRLALHMLDTSAGWGIRPPVVVADAAYGTNAGLRAALADRDLAYVLAVRADVVAHPFRREARRSGPQQPPRQSPPPTANGTSNVPQTAHPPLPSSTWTTGANPRRK
jgi:DDE superfamily endonuclease